MDWFTGLIVYGLIWWVTLFTVLPWGNHAEETPEQGHEAGAPSNPRLKLKFIVTTGLSCVIWVIVYLMIENGVISFRHMAQELPM